MNLTIHHLVFTVHVQTPVQLEQQSGSAIRGALFGMLWGRFCTNKDVPACADCPLVRACPVAALVAPLREEGQKGSKQTTRPYVVRPPDDNVLVYERGDTLYFGLGLFGSAAALFPYVVMAAHEMEHCGLGKKLASNDWRRGKIKVTELASVNPLRHERHMLFAAGQPRIDSPGKPITASDVAAFATTLPTDRITLHFKTPVRLVDQQRLVRQIAFRPLIQRLMRRLDELCMAYSTSKLEIDFRGLLEQAEAITVVDDQTHWVDASSHSSRKQRVTPIGGLVGQVTFAGDLTHLRELLVWGSLIHVGRNAVKGDGWYEFVP